MCACVRACVCPRVYVCVRSRDRPGADGIERGSKWVNHSCSVAPPTLPFPLTLLFGLPASSAFLPSAPSWFRSLSDSHCLDTANGQGLGLDRALLLLPHTVRLQHFEDADTFSACWVIWMFPQLHRVLTRSKGSFNVRVGCVRVKRTWISSCLDENSDTTSFCLVLTSVRDTCSFPRAISWALGGRRRSSRFSRSLAMR